MVAEFARRTYALLRENRLADLLLDDMALRAMLRPEAAGRVAALRHNHLGTWKLPPLGRRLLSSAEYAGACVQGLRREPADGAMSLARPGWVFDRLLLSGRRPGGGPVALWVEGTFVRTDQGILALTLERVETPRREHADLELAACDLRIGRH